MTRGQKPQSALPLSDKMIELIARRFRLLGDPTRLRILQALESGPKTVSGIVAVTDASQPNVSKHLQGLFEAGLVARSRSGNRVSYSIADPVIFKLCSLVCHSATQTARVELEQLLAAR